MFKNIVNSGKIYEINMGQTVKGQFQHPVSFFITIYLIGIIGLCQEMSRNFKPKFNFIFQIIVCENLINFPQLGSQSEQNLTRIF